MIRTKMADWRNSTTDKQSLLLRNWPLLLAAVVGGVLAFSVALWPLSALTVLVSVLGGAFAALAMADIVMLELARVSSKYLWDALEMQSKAQHASTQRIVSVLGAVALQPKRPADKPD